MNCISTTDHQCFPDPLHRAEAPIAHPISMSVVGREYQLRCLNSFLSPDPSLAVQTLLLQGAAGTGKTHTLKAWLDEHPEVPTAILRSTALVTWKPLLQAVARGVQAGLRKSNQSSSSSLPAPLDPLQVEDLAGLISQLTTLFTTYDCPQTFLLVLDDLDQLQDLDATILPMFLRLHELLPAGCPMRTVHIVRDAQFVGRYAPFQLPVVVFPRYTEEELLPALTGALATSTSDNTIDASFLKLLIQAFYSYTGSDIAALRDLALLKWPQYSKEVAGMDSGAPTAELYRRTRHLFVSPDDSLASESSNTTSSTNYELSDISKWLLIAAYFCSYSEARYDPSLFAHRQDMKHGRSPYGRRKAREINPTHLQPNTFQVERLLAIYQAIAPADGSSTGASASTSGSLRALLNEPLRHANVEVFQNIAELYQLKVLSTNNVNTGGNLDFLSPKIKWKVNVGWEIVLEVANSVQFDLRAYFSEVGG
ncbi:origin recognition complex subunit 5 [Maudiozyma humilis]|uniref:Origin recognition complex subunit 5 n=1 Tax=Maudiozyma humilis TaxID=51915 RepID=A0AAV5S2C7_MAUHU|nr:origin recognition complex subunit 5 [Kazachstania humilis]